LTCGGIMNSIISRSRLAVVALCGVTVVGCNAVEDVRDPPSTAVPTPTEVLNGKINGLGVARPVLLRYRVPPAGVPDSPDCLAPSAANPAVLVPAECKFFGLATTSQVGFSFEALPIGTSYNIRVVGQPYGKNCVVTNPTGTVGSGAPAPVVNCTDTLPRYNLTVNIPTALQTLPGTTTPRPLAITLTTEEKVETKTATGLASVTFNSVLMNSGTNLPLFAYKLVAKSGENLCTFTPNTAANQGLLAGGENRNTTDNIVVPVANTTQSLAACDFTATATVQYNGTPVVTLPTTGQTLQLALRNHQTGQEVQAIDVTAFTAGAATVSFPTPLVANEKAIYELVVKRQPAGQTCIVSGTTTTWADTANTTAGVTQALTAPTGGMVVLVDPANTDWWAFANRSVRCRANPAAAAQLVGTYQMDARIGLNSTNADRPYGRPREFLTFFADGTFMYGANMNSASTTANSPNETFTGTATAVRSNWAASSGMTHGFYAYNSGAGTITFTVLTSTITNVSTNGNRGITGAPGFAAGAVTATGVTKGFTTETRDGTTYNLGRLTMTFTAGTPAVTRRWDMTEPLSIPGELTGTWVSADHRRLFAYDQGYTYAFHMGVNGYGNMQDMCLLPTDESTPVTGALTRHAGSATNDAFVYTCTPGIINPGAVFVFARLLDLPNYPAKNTAPNGLNIGATTPQVVPGFIGRFPGTATQLDNRPTSPTYYTVTGDTLAVQGTLNGTPNQPALTFTRERVPSAPTP
jgi:hypothetical protein